MANTIDRGNLYTAGFIALFFVPALCTAATTFVVPATVRLTESLVCPEGSHLDTDYVTHSDFRGQRTDMRAVCVDARGAAVSDDVYPMSFGILYGVLLVLWAGTLVYFFRPRPTDSPPPSA